MNTLKSKGQKDVSVQTGAVISAIALLAMAVIAAISNFGVIQQMMVQGDAVATAGNLTESATRFRFGAVGLLVVAILDIIAGWGLYVTFRGVNRSVSLLGALLRVAYAAAFASVITSLFDALRAAPIQASEALFHLERFDQGWQVASIIFGIHLLVVGALVWRPDVFSRIVSVLLFVAGAGYLIDNFAMLLSETYTFEIAIFTFVGEVLLIAWLLIRGRKLPDSE
jgi:hypothetical protein